MEPVAWPQEPPSQHLLDALLEVKLNLLSWSLCKSPTLKLCVHLSYQLIIWSNTMIPCFNSHSLEFSRAWYELGSHLGVIPYPQHTPPLRIFDWHAIRLKQAHQNSSSFPEECRSNLVCIMSGSMFRDVLMAQDWTTFIFPIHISTHTQPPSLWIWAPLTGSSHPMPDASESFGVTHSPLLVVWLPNQHFR